MSKKNKPEQNFKTQKNGQNGSSEMSKNSFVDYGLPIFLILTGILIYSNSYVCSFHFDDKPNILDNRVIRQLSIPEIWNFSHNRFLPFLSFALNYHFGEYNVGGYHGVNLLIHLATTGIVYMLSKLIFDTPALQQHPLAVHKRWVAFGTAFLFVTHPLATQSVTYIVQRMAAMVAMFYLLSVLLYIKGRLSESAPKKYLLMAASIISGWAALHSKENAYTLPLAIILVEFSLLQRKEIKFRVNDYRIWVGIGLAVATVSFATFKFSTIIFKTIPPSFGTPYAISAQQYLLTQFSVIVKYIQLLFLPIHQNLDYDYPLATGLFQLKTLVSCFLLIALVGLAIRQYNRNRLMSFCIFWFFLTLSIESSIVPIADVIFEHRTYLPSFGFFLLLVSYIYMYVGKNTLLNATAFVLLLGCCYGIATYQRNKVWTDDFSLWNDVIEKSPEKARPWVSRADLYKDQGAWNEAIADYEAALSFNPNYALAVNNLGLVYKNLGQWEKAIQYYSKSISIDSADINGFVNRGVAFGFVQKYDSALNDLGHALRMREKINVTFNNRGIVFSMMGKYENALSDFDSAIALSPNYATAYKNRGCVFLSTNQFDKAIEDLNKAVEINPGFTEAYFYRGVVYGIKQDANNALKDYNKVLSIDPGYKNAITNRDLILQQLNQKPR